MQLSPGPPPYQATATEASNPRTYHSIPVHFSKHFHGREGYFTTISNTFATSPARPALVSLYGLAGIGKTQLAMRYCKSHSDHYNIVIWTEADTGMKIQESLSKHAVNLKLPGAELQGDSGLNCRILLEWLEGTGGSCPFLLLLFSLCG